ncbi:hypothetical protein SDC9_111784 [bioreactor metagenome]|uniref:Uncharacterized protein n=1 Tax=bioreactor metagenome TaxID=1076179 RepID=A0A645BNS7_9ZZZZ
MQSKIDLSDNFMNPNHECDIAPTAGVPLGGAHPQFQPHGRSHRADATGGQPQHHRAGITAGPATGEPHHARGGADRGGAQPGRAAAARA